MMRMMSRLVVVVMALVYSGCEKSDRQSTDAGSPASSKPRDSQPHDPDDRHGHASEQETIADARTGHSGEVIDLGTIIIGDLHVRASRDNIDIKPGGDAPIDVWIDGGVGDGVAVVRFWIGAEDAKGSIKTKAVIEDGKWHAHAEVPNPMPPDSKLWVEIEHSDGPKTRGAFNLKA